jgi:hypothetical protein
VCPAKQKVLLNLSLLEGRRPLESIADPDEREAVAQTHRWFRKEFLELR